MCLLVLGLRIMSAAIDLSQLPAPNVIEPLDYETILGRVPG